MKAQVHKCEWCDAEAKIAVVIELKLQTTVVKLDGGLRFIRIPLIPQERLTLYRLACGSCMYTVLQGFLDNGRMPETTISKQRRADLANK